MRQIMTGTESLTAIYMPGTTIAAMSFAMLVSVLVPVLAFIFFRKKNPDAKKTSVLVGALTFIISALVLEKLLHAAVFKAFGTALNANIWLYALYGGLAAAVFEETGRLLAMKYAMKGSLNKLNSVMYGIGHGGIESVIIVGLSYLSLILVAVYLNNAPAEKISVLMAKSPALFQQIQAIAAVPAFTLYLSGIERIAAFALQISLSYLVYRAVVEKKTKLFLAALGLHFFVDASAVIMAKYAPAYITELYLLSAVSTVSYYAFRKYTGEKEHL
jgi:uncharacterized membrane protein YhfC